MLNAASISSGCDGNNHRHSKFRDWGFGISVVALLGTAGAWPYLPLVTVLAPVPVTILLVSLRRPNAVGRCGLATCTALCFAEALSFSSVIDFCLDYPEDNGGTVPYHDDDEGPCTALPLGGVLVAILWACAGMCAVFIPRATTSTENTDQSLHQALLTGGNVHNDNVDDSDLANDESDPTSVASFRSNDGTVRELEAASESVDDQPG